MTDDLLVAARRFLENAPVISDTTRKAYQSDLSNLGRGFCKVGSKSTYYHLRAALIWYHYDSIRVIIDRLDSAGDITIEGAAHALQRHMDAINALNPGFAIDAASDQRNRISEYRGPHGANHSKRRGLGRLPADWRDQLLAVATSIELPPVLVLALTGCRPGELATGVQVETQGDQLLLTILGSKVSEKNGQPIRKILVDPAHHWVKLLSVCCAGQEAAITVRSPEAKLNRMLTRLAQTAMVRSSALGSTWNYRISAYSFRHQVAADLKALGAASSRIAEVLGHRSERTQTCYGQWNQGRAGGISPIIGVSATYLPRQHASTYGRGYSKQQHHRIVAVPTATAPAVVSASGNTSHANHKAVTQRAQTNPAPGWK